MRKFLISYSVTTRTGNTGTGRSFATAPSDLKVTEDVIRDWERQVKDAGDLAKVGINTFTELEG